MAEYKFQAQVLDELIYYMGGFGMKWNKHIKRRLIFGILLLSCLAGIVALNNRTEPILAALAEEKIRILAVQAMNSAISDTLAQQDLSSSLFHTAQSDSGVYVMQADSARLNTFASQCAQSAQANITELGKQGISFSWGTASGIPLLSGLGPLLQMHFTPTGSITPRCESSFTSAGINQTLHRITLHLHASIQIILPSDTKTIVLETSWPVAESIIVSTVPDAYTNVADEEDLLNLIPENE